MNMLGDAAGMMSELTGMLDNFPLSIDAGFMNISGAMNLLNGDLSFGGLSIPGLELPSIPDIPGFSDFLPNVSLDNLSITGFLDSCDSIWSGQISGIDSFLPQLNTFATYSESISNNGLAGAVTIIDNIQGAVFAITNEIQLAIDVTSSALDSASENTVQIGDMIEAQSEKLNWINDATFLNQWDSVEETLDAMPIDVSSADPENIQAVCDASIGGMQTETNTLQISLSETTAGL